MRTSYIYLICAILFISCSKDEAPGPEHVQNPYELEVSPDFPKLTIPADNPMTVEGVELGRLLYYDKKLSKDGERSCSSCHLQSAGFAMPGQNVLPHVNLAWNKNFLWNGKIQGSLEDIMLFEVQDFFKADPAVFNQDPEYRALFKKAYNVDVITHKELAYALSQFFRIMISDNSKFDQFMRGEKELTPYEEAGMNLFFSERGDCFHCHGSILLTDNSFHNIGLEADPVNEDVGLAAITANPADRGKFKTPTLRNVSLRKSYMHDGRFKVLEEVVEFYNSGVQMSPTLDPLMYKNDRINLGLTDIEKAALVAFLKTFTDEEFVTNPELNDPF